MGKRGFECEIRFLIDDIDKFMKRVNEFNPIVFRKYAFNDVFYIPEQAGEEWIKGFKLLRVRRWIKPVKYSQILFTHVRYVTVKGIPFKHTVYKGGKIEFYRGAFKTAKKIVRDLGFKHWITVKKEWGCLYRLEALEGRILCIEKVKDLGYVGEIEVWGMDLEKIALKMRSLTYKLGIPVNRIEAKPLARIYYEKVVEGRH